MTVLGIYVGKPKSILHNGKTVESGIYKNPVEGPVMARTTNLDGDGQANLDVHGGREKAIYAYSADYSEAWCRELGRESLEPSQFGENLLVRGYTDDTVVIGSRYRLGGAEVTVMQPRIPCSKLGIRVGDDEFPARFWEAGRLGFYLSVDREGPLNVGDELELLSVPEHGITLADLHSCVVAGTTARASEVLELLTSVDSGWVRRLKARTSNAG